MKIYIHINGFCSSMGLTRRETEIVNALFKGDVTADELALRLSVSQNTIRIHFSNIFSKTKAKNKVHLFVMFMEWLEYDPIVKTVLEIIKPNKEIM